MSPHQWVPTAAGSGRKSRFPAATASGAPAPEGSVGARNPAGAAGTLVNSGDLPDQFSIPRRTGTSGAIAVGVASGPGHSPGFLGKETRRTLKTSTRSRSLQFSRRRAAGSSRSPLVRPSHSPASVSLLHPVPHCHLGQIGALANLADRAIAPPAQPDDLGLELRCERAARTRLLLPMLSMMNIILRGRTSDLRCPSKQIKPTRRQT